MLVLTRVAGEGDKKSGVELKYGGKEMRLFLSAIRDDTLEVAVKAGPEIGITRNDLPVERDGETVVLELVCGQADDVSVFTLDFGGETCGVKAIARQSRQAKLGFDAPRSVQVRRLDAKQGPKDVPV